MKKLLYLALPFIVLASCDTSGVKQNKEETAIEKPVAQPIDSAQASLEPLKTVVEKKKYPNGLQIQWFKKGTGEKLVEGEVYEINYNVKLQNGELVDGNQLVNRDYLPFLVGYNLQGKGWDLAMKELTVGDFVEIYLPANLARGKKGIPGHIPPNSPNIIFLRVGKKMEPERIAGKTKVWVLEKLKQESDTIVNINSEVTMEYFVGTRSNPNFDNSFKRKAPFTFRLADNGIVPGLKQALIGSRVNDRLWILVPPSEAYGSNGFLDRVKPNESVFYNVILTDIR